MKIKRLIFLFLLLIPVLAFSQKDYPKQILYDSVKVTVLDSANVALINYQFIAYDQCVSQRKIQDKEINLLYKAGDILKAKIDNLNSQIIGYEAIDQEQQIQIDELNNQLKRNERKIKFLKATRVVFTCVGVAGGVYIGYLGSVFLP